MTILILGRRILALIAVVAFLYFAIGSSIFPIWFYALFWRGGLANSDFWLSGVNYWERTPILPIMVGASLLFIILLISRYKFWPIIDRLSGFLIVGSVICIVLTAFTLYARHDTRIPQTQGEIQPVPEFIFERRSFENQCIERTPDGIRLNGQRPHGEFAILGSSAPYQLTRTEQLRFSRLETDALSLTADPSNEIAVDGENRNDWFMNYCVRSEGNSENEARQRLGNASIGRSGDLVSVEGPNVSEKPVTMGFLTVNAPKDGPVLVHASFSSIYVRDMLAPVHVTAVHARATIVNTAGQVDAAGFIVDFAGAKGRVDLSSETDMNVKLTAEKFDGSLMAWAQQRLGVLLPKGFRTPFQIMVDHSQGLICRADICSQLKQENRFGLRVFTYAGDGSSAPENLHFRSERAIVVVDNNK